MKQIYILLSRTGTIPSRFIHLFTRRKYTHASIATEPMTNKFYSYARRNLHNFLIAGFCYEDIHKGIFDLFKDCECSLYSLNVSEENYNKIVELIEYRKNNYKKCTYRFGSIIPMWLGIKQELKLKMTCSQFTAMLLHETNACPLPKHPSLMHPSDFMQIKELNLIYNGKIKDCHFPKDTQDQHANIDNSLPKKQNLL